MGKETWIQIGEILRQHGFHIVQIDEDGAPAQRPSFAPMVARRGRPPKAASASGVATKVTRVGMRGRPPGSSTLTPDQVRMIRESYKPRTERVTAASLAQQYGVSIPTIRLIISGRDAAKHKLSPTDLENIRMAYRPANSFSAVELAGRFGVTPSTILAVAQGKTHRDVLSTNTAAEA